MRCKGCAAKVSPNALQHILEELKLLHPGSAVSALDGVPLAQEDAAVLPAPPAGTVAVQTVDVLNSPVDDPYTFGRIAAVHALSDCYAMGAQPATALAMVQVWMIHPLPPATHTSKLFLILFHVHVSRSIKPEQLNLILVSVEWCVSMSHG